MKIFVFENVSQLTNNWHSGGGLVVVANSEEHAKELVGLDSNIVLDESDWKYVKTYDVVGQVDATMYVFPDAGCC